MSRFRENSVADVPLEIARQIDALCDEFEAALKLGASLSLEEFADRVDERGRQCLLDELRLVAADWLRRSGVHGAARGILDANPWLQDELSRIKADDGSALGSTAQHSQTFGRTAGLTVRCPHCHSTIDLIVDASLVEIECETCGGTFDLVNDGGETRDAAVISTIAHFELIERLGMGAFGAVWKARDTILDRTVALKIPRREHLDPRSIEKFMREARAAAQLCHPNIISTHEVGRHGDTFYIVNDYVRGVSLADVIADHRLGIRDSVAMVATLADALQHAHEEGVIHRDIKPSNVLMDDDGAPHLMDFGLAKRNEHEITMTTDGAILGTPAYMSPEQAQGEGHRVDGRSDVYSLGVILFQLLTGELPFRGSARMLLHKVIHDEPPSPRTLDGRVPKDLETVCLKCLEKEPARRYVAARELAADLRRYLAGEPVLARRLGRIGRTLRWARRNRAIAGLLSATIITLLAATVVSSHFGWRAAQNASRADQQAMTVTDTLYDSLLQEIRLTRETRGQGYGVTVRQLIDRARSLETPRVDKDELRRQFVLSMGDFVAYPPQVIVPSSGQVTALRLTEDGSELFAGHSDGRIVVYNLATISKRSEVSRPGGAVISLALTPGGDELLSATRSGVVRVWRRTKGAWRFDREFLLGDSPQAVVFSADGGLLAYVKQSQLEIWNVQAGAKLQRLPTESSWSMRNGAFDASGRVFVGAYADAHSDTVGWAIWDLDAGKRRREFNLPSLGGTYPNAISISKTGDRMAIGFDEALLVYGMADFQRNQFAGIDATIAVAFSSANSYLATANIRGRITIWNPSSNRQLATLELPTPSPSYIALAFSSDGRTLVASNAERIQVWDLARAGERTVLSGHEGSGIPCAAFHPDGRLLATGGKDDAVRFWNLVTGQSAGACNIGEAVQTIAFSPDGRWLAAGGMGKLGAPHLRFLDAESMEVIHETNPAMGEVLSLAWSQDAENWYLAGCGEKSGAQGGPIPGQIALWKVSQELPLRMETVLQLRRKRCLATVMDPKAELVAWAEENRVHAWDLVSGEEVPLDAPDMNQGWHGLALLPGGDSVVYISRTGVAEVWDVKQNRRIKSLGAPGTFGAPHVALSPDGQWLAALPQLDAISIWHLPTSRHVYSLRPDSGAVWSLAWDASSRRLAVGQSDGGLSVWHLTSIEEKLAEFGLAWKER